MDNILNSTCNNADITDFQAPSGYLSGEANKDSNTCLNILSPDRDLNLGTTEKEAELFAS